MFSKYPQHMASHKNAASAKLKGPRNASAGVQHAAKNMYRAKPLAVTRVVAAAVSVAAVGVFGAVAFELAQSNLSFDPSGYIAAYSHGDAESGEAYRISPLSTDAEANRHDEDSDSRDTSAREQQARLDNAQGQVNLTGQSGTTAYNVTGSADGTGVGVAGGSGSGAGGTGGSGGGQNVPVINAGGASGGNAGGGAGGNGSGGNGGSGGSATSTANSYKYLLADPAPQKGAPMGDATFFTQFNGANGLIDPHEVQISPMEDAIYDGQMLDAWTLFCAMDVHWSDDKGLYYLACTKDEFASFPYLRIDSWTNAAGEKNPALCSSQPLTVSVSLRLSQDTAWTTRNVTIQPARSRLFVVGQPDSMGQRSVIWSTLSSKENLLGVNTQEAFMKQAGHVDSGGYLNALLLGWRENEAAVPYFYTLTPGRHVVVPGDIVSIDPAYKVRFQGYALDEDYRFDDDPTSLNNSRLQTLVDVDESVVSVDGGGRDAQRSAGCAGGRRLYRQSSA